MGTIFHNFSFSILLLFSNSFYVIDGDTVKENTGEKKTLRLIAIDAPEKSQFFGDSCKDHLQKLIKDKTIRYEIDSYDQYNRALVTLYANNENINLKMVKDGYSWAYHYTKDISYINAMNEAKKKKIGLWRYENPIDPYYYRKSKKN